MKLFSKCFLLMACIIASITAPAQNRYDIVIDEIMADPTPQIGLPNSEWIELRNTTTAGINLSGWRLGDASGVSGPMPAFNLLPDSCVVVCTASAVAALTVFGNTISVTSFPSLDNAGKLLFLRAPNSRIIHAVEYSINWYQNAVKSDGGWTLEMIDTKNPCSGGSNWKAASDAKGGTPGKINSVNGSNKDATGPRLVRGFATDPLNVTLVFDEPLDSLKAATAASYTVSDGIGVPMSAVALSPLFNRVSFKVATALAINKVYTVIATSLSDCAGNVVGNFNSCKMGLASPADSQDLVVNELLFNPRPISVDYVELFNRSSKIIDLKNMILANRSSAGVIGSLKNLNADNYLLFPGEYIVATEDAGSVKSQYLAKNPDAFTEIATMPSYPDDKGIVVLLNNAGVIIDELKYDAKWHFALIDNEEGISLERIDPNKPTNNPGNWTSAASTVGYGTPTYQNSQYRADLKPQGNIKITPEIFSPDNDGFDDFALVNFNFPEPGYVVNITIFDGTGRAVKILQKNATCAASGSFRWDGLNDKQAKVPIGIYVVYTEIFNLKGQKKNFKNSVVLARRF
ncbi:MAG: lamin tail domain-containing protein [Chitinophagaceae bacterium]